MHRRAVRAAIFDRPDRLDGPLEITGNVAVNPDAPATGIASLLPPTSLLLPENGVSINRLVGEDGRRTHVVNMGRPSLPLPFNPNVQQTTLYTKHPEKKVGKDYSLMWDSTT